MRGRLVTFRHKGVIARNDSFRIPIVNDSVRDVSRFHAKEIAALGLRTAAISNSLLL